MRSSPALEIPDRAQGGFALAVVLLALLALSAMATAGYLRSNTDYRINQNHRASMKAFYVSDAARSQYMGRGKLFSDTATYTYGDGSADVWTEQLISVDDSSTLYRLVSSGSHNSPEGGLASRRTGAVVLHKVASISVNAAITAVGGLLKNGSSGSVDGHDAAPGGSCAVAQSEAVAGLEVPPGGFSENGGGQGNGGGTPSGFNGNPGIDSLSVATQMLADLGIDWQGILDGSFAQADYTLSQDGYPSFSTDVRSDDWPLIVIDSPHYAVGPGHSGRGTLVFTGGAEFNGSFAWEGLILVGDEFISNGNNDIDGAVVAGLNLALGAAPQPIDLGNGTWTIDYHSCNVLNALQGIGWPVEEPGTWHEIF